MITWIFDRIGLWALPDRAIEGIGFPTSAGLDRYLLTMTWETMPRLGEAFLGLADATRRAADEVFAFAQSLPEEPEP